MLVTIEQAQRHLRIDDIDDAGILADLTDKVEQASHMVLDYLKEDDLGRWQDSAGLPLMVPPLVQAATLVWIGILWKNRDGESDESLELGHIPKTVSNILYRYRIPQLS